MIPFLKNNLGRILVTILFLIAYGLFMFWGIWTVAHRSH